MTVFVTEGYHHCYPSTAAFYVSIFKDMRVQGFEVWRHHLMKKPRSKNVKTKSVESRYINI